MSRLEIYRREDGKWAWRLVATNGQIIATDGGQGYERYSACADMGVAVVGGTYAECVVEVTAR